MRAAMPPTRAAASPPRRSGTLSETFATTMYTISAR